MEIEVLLNYDLVFAGDEIQCEIDFKSTGEEKVRILWASMMIYGQALIKNGSFLKKNNVKTEVIPVGSFLPTLEPDNGQYIFVSPQTILQCDLELEPNENKRVYYRCQLPINLPTSFFGSILKYSYFASIICQLDDKSKPSPSIVRFPIFIINPSACLENCIVPKFDPKLIEDKIFAESKDISTNTLTSRIQLQKLLGLKGDGRNWHLSPFQEREGEREREESDVDRLDQYVNNTLQSIEDILKQNSSKSMVIKRQGQNLVTITMETINFRPGESIRGKFDFSNSDLECLQTNVVLRYTEVINKEEIQLFPGEKYEHIHVIDHLQESTRNCVTTFFNFVLTVDSFPQFKTSFANLEWSLLFQFIIQGEKGGSDQFQFVLPINLLIHGYIADLDGKKGDECAHFNLII